MRPPIPNNPFGPRPGESTADYFARLIRECEHEIAETRRRQALAWSNRADIGGNDA